VADQLFPGFKPPCIWFVQGAAAREHCAVAAVAQIDAVPGEVHRRSSEKCFATHTLRSSFVARSIGVESFDSTCIK